jgi:hypothetical protein
MATFAHTVEIARPVEEVFAFRSPRGPLAARATRDELAINTLRLKHLLEENRA